MNMRPDHRLDLGWPAETVTWAQAQHDAELRGRQPDDPGVPRDEARDDFDRHALRAPVRTAGDDGPMRLAALVCISAAIALTAALLAVFALAWGL